MPKDLLQAIELATAGKWNEAHQIVQQFEADTTASWIHAVLHKIEGDLDNSRYWYRRAGKLEHAADEPMAELAEIRKAVAAHGKEGLAQAIKSLSDQGRDKPR
jgi:hypothetical protein